jgi:hypothetical protein
MSPANISEDQLLAYLELPEKERAGVADEFIEKVQRRIESHRPRLAQHAKFVLAKYRLASHDEDAASEVIFAAWVSLKKQISGQKVAYAWLRPMPLFSWLLVIHGKPFQREHSGVITNFINKHLKHSIQSLSELEDSGLAIEDDRNNDAETTLLLKERLTERRRRLEAAVVESRRQAKTRLNELDERKPRDVLIYRLRTGTHQFRELDAESVVSLAARLPVSTRNTVKTISQHTGISATKMLDAKTIGSLLGLRARRVRQIVEEVRSFIKQNRNSHCVDQSEHPARKLISRSRPGKQQKARPRFRTDPSADRSGPVKGALSSGRKIRS